ARGAGAPRQDQGLGLADQAGSLTHRPAAGSHRIRRRLRGTHNDDSWGRRSASLILYSRGYPVPLFWGWIGADKVKGHEFQVALRIVGGARHKRLKAGVVDREQG